MLPPCPRCGGQVARLEDRRQADVRARMLARVLALQIVQAQAPIYWGNGRSGTDNAPPDTPVCGFQGEKCSDDYLLRQVVPSVVVSIMLPFLVIFVLLYRHWRRERDLQRMMWRVDFTQLKVITARARSTTSSAGSSLGKSPRSACREREGHSDMDGTSDNTSGASLAELFRRNNQQLFTTVAMLRGATVAVKALHCKPIKLDRALLHHMRDLSSLKHSNLTAFVGMCTEPPNICVLWEYATKGSLQDIIANDDIKLDTMFQFSIATDICKGLEYLALSALGCHGNLKSSNCVIDSRWVCKLTDFGLQPLRRWESGDKGEHAKYAALFWTAPELVRAYMKTGTFRGTPAGDIYSLGVVVWELVFHAIPYNNLTMLTPREIIMRIAADPNETGQLTRPDTLGSDSADTVAVLNLLHTCWQENPDMRPSVHRALKKINKLNPNRTGSILDNMVAMMERYSNHLEDLVAERTAQLEEEKRKTDMLLYRMLPEKVAENLKMGQSVQAEAFESVTVYFSDIVGFTKIASESTPMQIVDLLNTLYTTFDATIVPYDVYKVETIGDAYMVASGLPVRNEGRHVTEMADVSLSLLQVVLSYTIPHMPERQLQIRIGLHTGSVVAGVVGLTMPRYCLFGDTVNTASRMESTGEALKIHMSPEMTAALRPHSDYVIAERGAVKVKGKGLLQTFWLVGKKGFFCYENGDRQIDSDQEQPLKSPGSLTNQFQDTGEGCTDSRLAEESQTEFRNTSCVSLRTEESQGLSRDPSLPSTSASASIPTLASGSSERQSQVSAFSFNPRHQGSPLPSRNPDDDPPKSPARISVRF